MVRPAPVMKLSTRTDRGRNPVRGKLVVAQVPEQT